MLKKIRISESLNSNPVMIGWLDSKGVINEWELKEGIGFSCVKLYMIENHDVSDEFTVLSNKFNSAINKLILCSKEQDTDNANLEFNNLIKSCDACHESFNKDMEGPLDFTDS